MRKTVSSRRISSAIASRNASRTVIVVVLPTYSGSAGGGRRPAAGAAGAGKGRARGASWRDLADGGVFSAAATSSPLAAITAIGVLTATCSVPSGTTIRASTPSSTASNSIVALSVSISARTSPALTGSPSLFSQRAILPSVIVGDSAGIRTSVAMACPGCLGFGQHVGPQLGRIGLWAVLRELRRFDDDVPDLGLEFCHLALAGAAFEQPMPDLFDRIVLGAHPGHLLAAAVFSRVRHRMPAIAVGHHLEDDRPLTRPRVLRRSKPRFMNRQHIHTVDLLARDPIGHAAVKQVSPRRSAIDRRTHPVAVVLDDVNDRQLPQCRHVETFVNLALVDRAVAEIGDRDLAVVAIMMSEREPGSDGHLGADDAMAAEEILFPAEHMHRAALTVRIAAPAPGQFRHDALGVHATRQHVAMVAIGGDNRVALLQRRLHANDDSLLPDIKVAEPTDQPHAVHLPGSLLEPPDQQHVSVVSEQLLRGDAQIGKGNRFGFALDCHAASSARPRNVAPRICSEHGGKLAVLQPQPSGKPAEGGEVESSGGLPRRRPATLAGTLNGRRRTA